MQVMLCTRKWTCVINTQPGGGGVYHTLNGYHVHVTRRRLLKRVNGQKADVDPLGGG